MDESELRQSIDALHDHVATQADTICRDANERRARGQTTTVRKLTTAARATTHLLRLRDHLRASLAALTTGRGSR